ncbi:hypothetical protein CF319_g5546 [Tilletia indica]|nr:hypothetical protein CF319_g5546 [Tilletia indica]
MTAVDAIVGIFAVYPIRASSTTLSTGAVATFRPSPVPFTFPSTIVRAAVLSLPGHCPSLLPTQKQTSGLPTFYQRKCATAAAAAPSHNITVVVTDRQSNPFSVAFIIGPVPHRPPSNSPFVAGLRPMMPEVYLLTFSDYHLPGTTASGPETAQPQPRHLRSLLPPVYRTPTSASPTAAAPFSFYRPSGRRSSPDSFRFSSSIVFVPTSPRPPLPPLPPPPLWLPTDMSHRTGHNSGILFDSPPSTSPFAGSTAAAPT